MIVSWSACSLPLSFPGSNPAVLFCARPPAGFEKIRATPQDAPAGSRRSVGCWFRRSLLCGGALWLVRSHRSVFRHRSFRACRPFAARWLCWAPASFLSRLCSRWPVWAAGWGLASGRGGSLYSIRQARKLGFMPGVSLFVVGVAPSAFFLASAEQFSLFRALSPAPQATQPLPKGIAGPGLNWSRSPAAGRGSLAGERYDEQTVSGPLTQAFWLGLNFNRPACAGPGTADRQPGRVYQWFKRPWGTS